MSGSADGHEATRIDKSVLTLSTPRRFRDKEHLPVRCPAALPPVRPQAIDPIKIARKLWKETLADKNEFAVPPGRANHRAAHRVGEERGWWKAAGLGLRPSARGCTNCR